MATLDKLQGPTVPATLQRAVMELVQQHGVERAGRMLGVGRESVLRIIAGVGVRRGTVAIASQRLAQLQDNA